MRKIYTMAAAMLMAASAAPAVAQTNDSETILDARLGEFIYHHDFYKRASSGIRIFNFTTKLKGHIVHWATCQGRPIYSA